MADTINRQLASLATGLNVNESTGEVTAINMDSDVISEGSTNLFYSDTRVSDFLNSGTNLIVAGDLTVNGTTTTINSTTLTVDDKNIELASGSADRAAANGAGITIDLGSDGTSSLSYSASDQKLQWDSSNLIDASSSIGDLSDVSLTGISDGETLVWNAGNSRFEAGAGGGGGGNALFNYLNL